METLEDASKKEVINCLVDAYNIISKGWCRKNFKRGDRHCLIGGVAAASGLSFSALYTDNPCVVDTLGEPLENFTINDHETAVHRRTIRALEAEWSRQGLNEYNWSQMWEWNDKQTTKKPVLQLIKDTIEAIEND